MRQLSPQEIVEHMQQAETTPVLLDVREPSEFEICQIEGSINIPMGDIPSRMIDLDHEQEYVLICHHGIRSQRVGMYLVANDFEEGKLINMVGGIDAWACDIAPDMARY